MRPKLPFRKPRSRAKKGPAFVFVDTDQLSVGSQGKDVRLSIRRQAARSGRSCRRNGSSSHGKIGSPLESGASMFALTESVSLPVDEDCCPSEMGIPSNVSNPGPAPQLSYNGYETMRVRYSFDLTDLTSFTDADLGRFACLSLRDKPTRLVTLLQKRSSSFLTFLPSRYGSSACLDDAMHCVAARVGQVLGFPIKSSAVFVLYAKALKSLYTAIGDETRRLDTDVYCTTRLLTLYELIGLPEANHWVFHNRAGIRLVELRGPENHKSRFDRMLLKSQGPSIMVDEMCRKQTSIFETPEWQGFFGYASQTETDNDTRLWWDFFAIISLTPGIFKDISILFNDTLPPFEYLARSSDILGRAKKMYRAVQDSHILYQRRAPHPPSLFDLPVSAETSDRARLRGFFLYLTMYTLLINATLSQIESERAASEAEVQIFANQALLVEKVTAELDPATTWHLEQRNALAHSIIQTKEELHSDKTRGMSNEELMAFLAQRWLKWEDLWNDGFQTGELGRN